jgi:hypothetical protein
VEGRQLRDRDAIALDLVGVVGITAFLIGLTWLQTSEKLGFDAGGALDGVISQLPVTLTAGLLVLVAMAIELAAGLVLARAARRHPFDSFAEALLAAMVAAVLKDTLLLGLLGGFGLFLAPVLLGTNLAVLVGGVFVPAIARHVRPFANLPRPREALGSIGSITVAALVLVVWAGPIVLQLASPVVPFIDVLPNYVGPVEHLRTFGWFEPLTATQSPIIGPSRSVLGYDGLLGSLATMTGLSGALAIAGFILPQTILVGAGAYRLASAIRNGDPPVGAWALLAFALSQPFARLADARGTVVVVPLVCLGLAVAAELVRAPRAEARTRADDEDPWRLGRGAVIGLALGAAILVHPVIGFFAVATVAIVALLRPHEAAPDAAVAGLTAGLIALPQMTTMMGLPLPTIVLGIWLPIAIAIGVAAGRLVETGDRLRAGLVSLAEIARIALAVGAGAALALGFAVSVLSAGKIPAALAYSLDLVLDSSGLLLVVLVTGAVLGGRGARSPLVWAGLAIGAVAVFLTQVLPDDLGLLGSALRFEVPKTVHYWLSMIAAAGAASALGFLWAAPRNPLPWAGRVAAIAAFVIVAALPLRMNLMPLEPVEIDAAHLGEHRWSETVAIDLRFAETGFWQGFPDSRTVVDEPRQELLDRLRAEIDAGRLRHDTPVLHVASSFQQWVSTPLGVFDGVFETFLSGCPDIGNPRCHGPEVSHHTVGGRLFDVADLHDYLDPGRYPYVVLEPRDLSEGLRDQILGAGYASIFDNEQGEIFGPGS